MPSVFLKLVPVKLDQQTYDALVRYAQANGHVTGDGVPRLSLAARNALQERFRSGNRRDAGYDDGLRQGLHDARQAISDALRRLWRGR